MGQNAHRIKFLLLRDLSCQSSRSVQTLYVTDMATPVAMGTFQVLFVLNFLIEKGVL